LAMRLPLLASIALARMKSTMASNNQMQRDLHARVRQKLQQWMHDSEDLFEMGELTPLQASESIIENLMYGLTFSIVRCMPPNVDADFVATFRRLLAHGRTDNAAVKKQREKP